MKFCKWFGVLFFFGLGCSIAADAQIGIYATATGTWFGGVTCPSFASPCAETDGKVKPFGGNFGVYYDWRTYGPIRLGFDARGAVETSNKRADSGAGGPGIVKNYEGLGGVRGRSVRRFTGFIRMGRFLGESPATTPADCIRIRSRPTTV